MPKTFAECQAYRDAFQTEYDNLPESLRAEEFSHHDMTAYVDPHLAGDMEDNNALPEDLNITEEIPGVDPMGMFCDVDMKFMRRLNQVKIAATLCPQEHQAAIGGIFTKLGDPTSDLHKDVLTPMKEAAEKTRLNDRFKKMSPTREMWNHFDSEDPRKGKDFDNFEELVSNMEYMVGLRSSEFSPAPNYSDSLAQMTGVPQGSVETLHQSSDEINARPSLNISYPDMKNILAQRYLAHPNNLSKTTADVPSDYHTPEVAEKAVSNAVTGAANYSLDAMYKKIERRQFSGLQPDQPNRGTLITVDGKTVAQRMADEYAAAGKNPSQYNQWYKDNLNTKSAEYVSAGLMAGKRVESFFPDKKGKFPDTPSVITKTGVEPTPLQPVTFNAWERFFSKHGFYKEKVTQKEEYDRVMEGRKNVVDSIGDSLEKQQIKANRADMAKRVKAASAAANQAVENSFVGQHKTDGKLPSPTGELKLDRTSATTACMGFLASCGHSFEDILDPNKLQEDKKFLGDYYVAVATGKTPPLWTNEEGAKPDTPEQGIERIGKWMYKGQKAIVKRLDKEMEQENVDFYDLDQHPRFPIWSSMSKAAFDISQNKEGRGRRSLVRKSYLDAAEYDFTYNYDIRKDMQEKCPSLPRGGYQSRPLTDKEREQCSLAMNNPTMSLSFAFKAYSEALDAAANPLSPESFGKFANKATMASLLSQRKSDNEQNERPQPASQLITPSEGVTIQTEIIDTLRDNPHAAALLNKSPKELQHLNLQCSNGRLADRFTFSMDSDNIVDSIDEKMHRIYDSVTPPEQRVTMPERPKAQARPQARPQAQEQAQAQEQMQPIPLPQPIPKSRWSRH